MTQSPFLYMKENTPTVLWNDSADPKELKDALNWGIVGATCNPVIALTAIKADAPHWVSRIKEYAKSHPAATEDEIGWEMVKELSTNAAKLLEGEFEKYNGRNGRLSIQTDPRNFRNAQALAEQAVEFSQLAKNMIVKIPVTTEAISAFEEATYQGVSLNATVSFSVAQTVAVAEAIERGLKRREAEGLDISQMGPVCTIMVGRVDDWVKVSAEKLGAKVDPEILEWSGVAVFRNAHKIYQERGYRTRLLSAAFRNHMHWSEILGGDSVISPPYAWQVKINEMGIAPNLNSVNEPIEARILDPLLENFSEFRKMYDVDGLAVEDFTNFGGTLRTLRGFLQSVNDLESFVRDVTVPNPDK
ncbi:MipB Transaldolase [Candidatus Planktophila dulcis]|uniref:transaldolase family protein n=1 Tax=Candidatus Planktophila dulcis TaxID=1884914 RepID=UPI003CF43DC3